jgi:TetR/AcrR family transcriptional regulator
MEQADKSPDRKRLDPAKTRETILRAAFETFAESGYEGASIADIAKAAGVPKSLVQYHFGSKEELWEACLRAKAGPMMEAVDRFLDSDSRDPRELISARFSFLKENPEMRRMLFWAGMSPGPMPGFIQERRQKVLQKFGGNTKGKQFARFMAVLAATDGWFLFRNFYQGPFGETVFDEDLERRLLEVLLDTVIEK